jgi:hypothetical protein
VGNGIVGHCCHAEETSRGGSVIHRYDRTVWSPNRIGFTGESIARFSGIRNEVNKRLFGEVRGVFREVRPLIPRVDIHAYCRPDQNGRDIYTVVTSGMSDLADAGPSGRRSSAEG